MHSIRRYEDKWGREGGRTELGKGAAGMFTTYRNGNTPYLLRLRHPSKHAYSLHESRLPVALFLFLFRFAFPLLLLSYSSVRFIFIFILLMPP